MKKFQNLHLHIEVNKGYKADKDPSKPAKLDLLNIPVNYGTTQYNKFVSNIPSLGALSAKVVAAFTPSDKEPERGEPTIYDEIDLNSEEFKPKLNELNAQLSKAFGKEQELTPEQKEIAELKAKNAEMEAKMDAILAGNAVTTSAPVKKVKDDEGDSNEITPELIAEYTELVGKKPHHLASYDTINKRIEEEKAKLAE